MSYTARGERDRGGAVPAAFGPNASDRAGVRGAGGGAGTDAADTVGGAVGGPVSIRLEAGTKKPRRAIIGSGSMS